MQSTQVKILGRAKTLESPLYYARGDLGWCVHLDAELVGWLRSCATDVFEALFRIRLVLESHEMRVVCNGARENAWASSMARDMGGGTKVYLTALGRRTYREDLVPTFGGAPDDSASSVRDQLAFHNRWMKSVRSLDAATLPLATILEAKLHPDGWVYKIDEASSSDPGLNLPSERINGAWKVDEIAVVAGAFEANPRYGR